MHGKLALYCAALATGAAAEIFKFPLANGFPNATSNATIQAIQVQAGGPLPSSSGGNLSTHARQALQALAFNEIFEVAFFTQLLQNVTQSIPAYQLDANRQQTIAALNGSQAQEQLHFLSANAGLTGSGNTGIQPCEYDIPAANFTQAMEVAYHFSGLVLGSLAGVITDLGASPPIVSLFSSIIGQEGQQDGYYRWLKQLVPNENAFLTTTPISFFYNHVMQQYVVAGTCPQKLDLPTYNTLLALEKPSATNTIISFRTTQPNVTTAQNIVYISGQTIFVEPITGITRGSNATTTFNVSFPFDSGFSRGFTVAALVSKGGQYSNVSQVADATLAGPAVIEVNYM